MATAAVTNTLGSRPTGAAASAYGAQREQLSNVVSRVNPEDSPIFSLAKKGKATSVYPEWTIDDLPTPGTNVQPEGGTYSFQSLDRVDRVGNPTQTLTKEFIVSRTADMISTAGMADKTKYQKIRQGIALRRDVEYAIVSNNTAVSAGASREMGGLPAWFTTNVSRAGSPAANGGFNSTTKLATAATNGTQRAFTLTLLNSVLQSIYQSGGNTKYVICSPYVKSVFSSNVGTAGTAEWRYAAKGKMRGGPINQSADMYLGPFNEVTFMPNRVQHDAGTARNAFLIDPDEIELLNVYPIMEDTEIGRVANATPTALITETTICPRNERSHGVIADLFGLTSNS